jgi:hypothetical protein
MGKRERRCSAWEREGRRRAREKEGRRRHGRRKEPRGGEEELRER